MQPEGNLGERRANRKNVRAGRASVTRLRLRGMGSVLNSERLAFPANDEVHCWTVRVSEEVATRVDFEGLLSPDEALAAKRFLREADRERYAVAHGILRQLLGRYLGCASLELKFTRGEFGKPALVLRKGWPEVTFNLAHSGDFILLAVAIGRRVGVDVEKIGAERDAMELARSQFSEEEIAGLEKLEAKEQVAAFYGGWTLKEAYVKARGEGLGFPLKNFTVTIGDQESPRVRWALDDLQASERWSAFRLSLVEGYAGAVVVEGRLARLVERLWR